MIKRTIYPSLVLLLAAGIFSTTACSEQATPKMETSSMTELIKTAMSPSNFHLAPGASSRVGIRGWKA
jgi:hypothetical protein